MVRNRLSLVGRVLVLASASVLLAALSQPGLAAHKAANPDPADSGASGNTNNPATAKGTIYKYIDKDGRTVFGSSVPAEYVRNGYTIINDHGIVIQQVPRAPTADELNSQQASKATEQKALADKVAQAEADKLLIRLYRTPEDITKKRDLALSQLKIQQDLVKLNLTKSDAEIVRVQGIIDNNIKANRQPPADITKKMELARGNKEKFEAQFKKMDADRDKLMADAERDSKRLQQLIGTDPAAKVDAKPASAEKPATQ